MSRRELAALGIPINTNNVSGMSNTGATVVNTGEVETFSLHPHSEIINPSTVVRKKAFLGSYKRIEQRRKDQYFNRK